MNNSLKNLILNITSPKRRYGYFGNYSRWQQARQDSKGYDSSLILKRVKKAALQVRREKAAYERDSVLFDKIQYSWPVLACLLWIALKNKNKLNLVDFGGSLGTSYFQNRELLKHLKELKWNIVEQKNFVMEGKKYFEGKHLKFYDNLEKCSKKQNLNTILFSSSLQYLERPYDLLEKIADLKIEHIIFDRTPFLEKGNDRITVQKVPPRIYDASYPCWIFGLKKFLKFFRQKRYQLVADFASSIEKSIKLEKTIIKFKGFFFVKK